MFGRKQKNESPGAGLRAQALALDPAGVGMAAESVGPVWGVVMDTAQPTDGGWHCLVALADGTTSLYTSGTFGILGAGAHESVRAANQALLAQVTQQLDVFAPSTSTDLPPAGSVTIRAMTFGGPLQATVPADVLMTGRHPASLIFRAAHLVVTQLRIVTQAG